MNSRSLDIRSEHPIRFVVRVANVMTKPWPLATNLTFTGHTGPLYVVVLIHLRLRTRLARQAFRVPAKMKNSTASRLHPPLYTGMLCACHDPAKPVAAVRCQHEAY